MKVISFYWNLFLRLLEVVKTRFLVFDLKNNFRLILGNVYLAIACSLLMVSFLFDITVYQKVPISRNTRN